jgi:hypothetical protein
MVTISSLELSNLGPRTSAEATRVVQVAFSYRDVISLRGLNVLWALAMLLGSAAAAAGQTPADNVGIDTTWTRAGSPYYVGRIISVADTATLTIEAGVEVVFARDTYLVVHGSLRALGTVSNRVRFRGAAPRPGWWLGLHFIGTRAKPATGTLAYTVVENGGHGTSTPDLSASRGNVYVFDGRLTVSNSEFRGSPGDGITAAARATADISDTSFIGNAGYAARLMDVAMRPRLARLTAQGNGLDAVAIGGSDNRVVDHDLWEFTGVPYVATHGVTVPHGTKLSLEPGVQVYFTENTHLVVLGDLRAVGTDDRPITISGLSRQAGSWFGIRIGNSPFLPAAATLNNVVVEYGGRANTANITAFQSKVRITNSVIRNSGGAGLSFGVGTSGAVVETSHIVDNATFGIENTDTAPGRLILAMNNWWGAANGPSSVTGCHLGGAGSTVSGHVAVRPFLVSEDDVPGPVAAGDARILALTPQRWFVPADGVTALHVTITLRDGRGRPLSGRRIRLSSHPGSTVDGGLTDATGATRAIVRSTVVGDAELVPILDSQDLCEFARADATVVTFTAPEDSGQLMSDAEAPYVNTRIEALPSLLVRGVRTRLRATLTNPYDFPIRVNTAFAYANSGIGLAFGPVGEVRDRLIPAKSDGVIEVDWVPIVAGPYCIEVRYIARPDGVAGGRASRLAANAAGGLSGRSSRNLNVYPGPLLPPPAKDAIAVADAATDALGDGLLVTELVHDFQEGARDFVGFLIPDQLFGNIIDFIVEAGGAINCGLAGGVQCGGWKGPRLQVPIGDSVDSVGSLLEDPPSPNYRVIAAAPVLDIPAVLSGPATPPARAAAMNRLAASSAQLLAQVASAAMSFDRYAGAVIARDTEWSAVQAASYLHYLRATSIAMNDMADALESLVVELQAEGIARLLVTSDAVRAHQERIRHGFGAEALEAAGRVGFDEEAIETIRQRQLARQPESIEGDLMPRFLRLADALRRAGREIAATSPFGAAAILPAVENASLRPQREAAPVGSQPDHDLVRVFDTTANLQVGNPTDSRATVDLRTRPIALPLDWSVLVSPAAVTLDPGEQTTVTVSIRPGLANVQGGQPRVALEGYIGDTLIGGVALDVVAPRHVTSLPGDVNHDGAVDCADVALVRTSFGKKAGQLGFDPNADVNVDGLVDVRDLAFVAQRLPVGTRCR